MSLLLLFVFVSSIHWTASEDVSALKYCTFKGPKSSCDSSTAASPLHPSRNVVQVEPGNGVNVTCVSFKFSFWVLRLPKNASAVAGEIKMVYEKSGSLLHQTVIMPGVRAVILRSVRYKIQDPDAEKLTEIIIDSTEKSGFKFVDHSNYLSYYTLHLLSNDVPVKNPVQSTTSTQGPISLPKVNRKKVPGCKTGPHMVSRGFVGCIPTSLNVEKDGEEVHYESWDQKVGFVLPEEPDYNASYVCSSAAHERSAVFEPAKKANHLKKLMWLDKDTINCSVFVDDPNKYPNVLELVISECQNLVDGDLKYRPFNELGDLVDESTRATATGESWGRKLSAPLSHLNGAVLCSGLSDASLPEQYFAQDYSKFFTGFDFFPRIASYFLPPLNAVVKFGRESNKLSCSVVEFLVPHWMGFELEFSNEAFTLTQPTEGQSGGEMDGLRTVSVKYSVEKGFKGAVKCVVDYMRYGRLISDAIKVR